MDKLILPAFLIENLRFDAKEDAMRADIRELLQAVKRNVEVPNVQIKFYEEELETGGKRRFARVRDVVITWGEVKKALNSQHRIQDFAFKLSPDFGMLRNHRTGEFLEPLSGYALQFFQDMFLSPRKGLHELWNPALYPKMDIGNQTNRVSITNIDNPNFRLLWDAGRTLSWKWTRNANHFSAEFITFLDKLQAISVINNNPRFCKGGVIAGVSINRQGGLGHNGQNLRLSHFDETLGYVPFSEFDEQVLPPYPFDTCYRRCYKCDNKGTLEPLGITTCGLFIAARCNTCEYQKNPENPLLLNVALNCFGEKFTRVRLGINTIQNYTTHPNAFNVVHTPLQLVYDNAKQARDIICKVVSHEASYDRMVFKLANTRSGMLLNWKLIEILEPSAEGEKEPANGSLYLVTLRVYRTDVWAPDNIVRFHHVTCFFRGKVQGKRYEMEMERRAKVFEILPNGTGNHVFVKLRVKGLNRFVFRKWSFIRLEPSCPVVENVSLNSVMSHWVSQPDSPKFQCLNGLLLRQARLELIGEQLPLTRYECDWLNVDQKDAFGQCRDMSIVAVQGPPGTGKTSTAVSFLLKAATNEKGLMIAAARSNVAADKLATDIIKYKNRYPEEFGHVRIVRMASVKREQIFIGKLPQYDVIFREESERYLHDEVIKRPDFWNDFADQELFDKINREGMNGLTTKEMQAVQRHVNRHAYKVLNEMNIIVTTLSTLSDNRLAQLLGISLSEEDDADLEEFADIRDTGLKVNTILLDEAGVIPFPMLIPVLIFNPKRILLFGDNDQLPPQINCPSAESACLSMSTMTYVKYGHRRHHGRTWKMLKTQYRMHPHICQIVSHMTYHGKLLCGDHIFEREEEPEVKTLVKKVTRAVEKAADYRVVVLDHNGSEQALTSGSKQNRAEAVIVAELVSRLMLNGVEASSITVLTFYDAQRNLIENQLRQEFNRSSGVRVCNIDAFQGQESDIVILSMVRGNDKGEIGFCKSPNRLNVMISRARYFQFIVGNMDTFFRKAEHHIERLRKSLREAAWVKMGNGEKF